MRLAIRLAVLAALLVFPAQSAATFSGPNGRLVFEVAGDNLGYIEPSGGEGVPVFFDDTQTGSDPSVSPDGTTVAFAYRSSFEEDTSFIATTPITSGPPYDDKTSTGVQGRTPEYMPDGRILFSAADGEIHLMNADGTGDVQLSSHGGEALNPVPSVDGASVYYGARTTVEGSWRWGIYKRVIASGTTTTVLPPTADFAGTLDVSPDGTELLYIDDEALMARNLSSGASRLVRSGYDWWHGARFSPDGNSIVLVRDDGLQPLLVDLDGTNPRTVPITNISDGGVGDFAWTTGQSLVVNDASDGADADDGAGPCDADAEEAGLQCTLHAAIDTANAREGADEMTFDVGDGGPQTIVLDEALPEITDQVEIDGPSQPGTGTEPRIAIDGSGAGAGADGLTVGGEKTVIRGLDVYGFEGSGIVLGGDGGHVVEGSWIGFKRNGTAFAADGNGSGIDIAAADVRIGGPLAAQRNVVSANGNVAAAKAFVDDFDGDVAQPTLHQTFKSFGTGIVISDGDAQHAVIENNLIGPDPNGGRFGEASGLTSTFGVMVGPDAGSGGGILTDVWIAGNVLSGNLFGVIGLPEAAGTAVVDGLEIRDNLIGARPDGTAGPGLGGLIGVSIQNAVTGVEIAGNTIQGQVLGVVAQKAGVRVQDNTIGVNEDIDGLVGQLDGASPSFGQHNLIGVILGGTDGALLGGPGGLGNDILGNVIGAVIAGAGSQNNAVLGNRFGLTGATAAPETVGDAGSIFGVLMTGGTDNDIGDPGAGNTFSATAIGAGLVGTSGGHLQANRFSETAFGLLGAQAGELRIGGAAGQGNTFASSTIGAFLVGWAPTAAELALAKLDEDAPVGKDDRELAFDAPVGQGVLGFVDGTSPVDIQETAVALGDPPGGGAPALRPAGRGDATNAGSDGTRILGNTFGGDGAENTVAAWLLGTHTDAAVSGNTFAHNDGGGLWLGSPVALTSAVPEPSGVTLTGNRIFDNYSVGGNLAGVAALGFDLLEPKAAAVAAQGFGPTANDPLDADVGANGRQNAPAVASVTASGASARVTGTLASKPSTAYKLELFANERCNAFGSGEGEVPVGTVDVKTGANGSAPFSVTVTLPAGKRSVTANATGPEGTSEFSGCTAAVAAEPTPVPPLAPPSPEPPVTPPDVEPPDGEAGATGKKPKAGDPVTVTVTSDESGTVTATGSIETSGGAAAAAKRKKATKVKVALTRRKTAIKAGQTLKLKLKPKGRKAIRGLKKAMKRGAKATAVVRIVFTDLSGNRSRKTVRVKLRRG